MCVLSCVYVCACVCDGGGGGQPPFYRRQLHVARERVELVVTPSSSFMGKGIIDLPPQEVYDSIRNPQLRFTYDNMLKVSR